jgi:hypothetical protein
MAKATTKEAAFSPDAKKRASPNVPGSAQEKLSGIEPPVRNTRRRFVCASSGSLVRTGRAERVTEVEPC